jgi:hypothetical protein
MVYFWIIWGYSQPSPAGTPQSVEPSADPAGDWIQWLPLDLVAPVGSGLHRPRPWPHYIRNPTDFNGFSIRN